MLHVEGLTKSYKTGESVLPILKGVSLTVEKGEFVAIMGPSGSGKSTFMNMLGCLDRPDSGTYTLDGIEVSKLTDKQLAQVRNQKIGFVFQSFNLLARSTAL
ncbi:ABC transporter ATP-binding protein, partial [Anoxybacillus sp. LAT_38]